MKVIRWIQNVAATAAFIMALNLVDGLGVSIKDEIGRASCRERV